MLPNCLSLILIIWHSKSVPTKNKVNVVFESWMNSTTNFTFSIPDTIAFHTVLTSYNTIPEESAVVFNEVLLNEGDGYVSCTKRHIFHHLFSYKSKCKYMCHSGWPFCTRYGLVFGLVDWTPGHLLSYPVQAVYQNRPDWVRREGPPTHAGGYNFVILTHARESPPN